MEYKLTNKQLFNSFKSIMEEYSELDSQDRSYDYYDYEKHGYVDANVVNYYENEEEDWEDDDWIFQVQYERGDWGKGLELPILRYAEYQESGRFMSLKSIFGDLFEPLLKEWFNKTYPLEQPIKTVTKEQD
jgi:hypothetical protein